MEQLNDTQRDFVNSIRMFEANKALSGTTLREEFADMFPPASLFKKDLCVLPAVFIELSVHRNPQFPEFSWYQHAETLILTFMMILTTNVYTEPENTDAATAIVK